MSCPLFPATVYVWVSLFSVLWNNPHCIMCIMSWQSLLHHVYRGLKFLQCFTCALWGLRRSYHSSFLTYKGTCINQVFLVFNDYCFKSVCLKDIQKLPVRLLVSRVIRHNINPFSLVGGHLGKYLCSELIGTLDWEDWCIFKSAFHYFQEKFTRINWPSNEDVRLIYLHS